MALISNGKRGRSTPSSLLRRGKIAATLDLYQTAAQEYAIYPGELVYPSMGLASEAGEVLSLVKKLARDEDMHLDIEYPDSLLCPSSRDRVRGRRLPVLSGHDLHRHRLQPRGSC